MTDVHASLMLGASLPNQDRPGINQLSAEALDAQALTVRIAAVCRGAATFFMCHGLFPFLVPRLGTISPQQGRTKVTPLQSQNPSQTKTEEPV
jgi:hypothetical protein